MALRTGRAAIHFALTSHGLGHITRSLAVIRALHDARPDWSIFISSTADTKWILSQLGFSVRCRHQAYEPGAIQRNCFEVDVARTISAYRQFRERYAEIMEGEIRFLRSQKFVAVVSDIPALPVAAASHVGIPAVGVSNFTWDWILEPWCGPDDAMIVDNLRADYAAGTYQLCLPLGPSRSSFPDWEPAPLLSGRAKLTKSEVRSLLGLTAEPLAVVCPGGWDADEWPSIHARSGPFQLVTVNNLPITSDMACRKLGHDLPAGITMPDLIAASDVVLGKPGYGLASECITHRTPFAMIDRPNFRETPFLVKQLRDLGRCATMSISEFFSGDWEGVLARAQTEGSDWAEIDRAPEDRITSRILELIAG